MVLQSVECAHGCSRYMNSKELRLRSEAGYGRVCQIIASTRFELCEVASFENWKAVVQSRRTKVNIRCTLCNFDYAVTLGTLTKLDFSGKCLCRHESPCEKDDYYQRVLATMQGTNFTMVDVHSISDWKKVVAKSGCLTKIAMRCSDCGVVAHPWVSSFISNGKAACLCSGAIHCHTEGYYNFICDLIEPSRFEMVIGSYQEWLNIVTDAKSKIDVKCATCSMTVSPTINMVQSGTVGCGCRNFNCETRVFEFVKRVLDSENVQNGCEFTCVAQKTDNTLHGAWSGRRLKLDIAVLDVYRQIVLIIEVDGGHHFDPCFKYRKGDCTIRRPMQNDVTKEKWAIGMKIPMLRITSCCVLDNRVQWNAWIQGALIKVLQSNLDPCIYRRSHHDCYSSVHYTRMRDEHLELKEGIPFPLAVDPLPFPPLLL